MTAVGISCHEFADAPCLEIKIADIRHTPGICQQYIPGHMK